MTLVDNELIKNVLEICLDSGETLLPLNMGECFQDYS